MGRCRESNGRPHTGVAKWGACIPDFRSNSNLSISRRSRGLPGRAFTPTHETAEQAALALSWNQVDVADEPGSALAPFENDLAAVKGLQLDPMRDADDGGVGKLLRHHLHHPVLALLVECGRRLVEHDDIRR